MDKGARIILSIKPLLLAFKILGIFGCSISFDRVKVSSLSARFYPIIWIILSISFSTGIIKDTDIEKIDAFQEGSGVYILRKVANFFTVTSDMYVAIFQQRKIVKFLENIDDYDRRLIDLGFVRHDAMMIIIYFMCLAMPGFMLFYNKISEVYRHGGTNETFFATSLACFGPSMHYIIVMKLCIFIHLMYRRFRYLNDNVVPKICAFNSLMYKHGTITIYDVRYMHAKLCESAEILMSVYGPWLILWFCVMTNAISRAIIAYPDTSIFPNFGLIVIWLVTLCVCCGLASDEANKISQRLIEQRVSSHEANDTVDRIEMALYLCNHELRFTAMRVYAINRSFLLAILSMILSYMTFISSK